ncbi:MAG: cobyric acid synthase, partial [Chloroflexota bacterium]|nr:cobyric acid synthase [Chloroflexota bacterium]
MLQGTGSAVGKSVLVAALCRLFHQDGLRVAPFKAQNMALNSFVTREGGEMGRAQVVQAEAAGIEPTVDMNPILIKPEADARSQVVVLGKAAFTLPAWDYYRHTEELWVTVERSFRRLASDYDLVIIEGAGSPAEVNLREHEIVNMRVARMAGAPVLLVGDIDKGGVFASLVGTMAILRPVERRLVKGFIINKFRGDLRILKPGLDWLEEYTHRPVLGVVPYDHNLFINEEDSIQSPPPYQDGAGVVDIAVIRLPRISNSTDFEPLQAEPGVRVRYISHSHELGEPDALIIPGTKSTMADLAHLRRSGLADAILERAKAGTPVVGICGGFQM